jgi:hypothetical protein
MSRISNILKYLDGYAEKINKEKSRKHVSYYKDLTIEEIRTILIINIRELKEYTSELNYNSSKEQIEEALLNYIEAQKYINIFAPEIFKNKSKSFGSLKLKQSTYNKIAQKLKLSDHFLRDVVQGIYAKFRD